MTNAQTNLNAAGEVASLTMTAANWQALSPDYRIVTNGRRWALVLCSRCGTVLAPVFEPGEALPDGHAPGTQLAPWRPAPYRTPQGPSR